MGDLTTAAQVKAYLGKDEGGQDAIIDMLVSGVSAKIEGYCRQPISSTRNPIEYQYGRGSLPWVLLDFGPISKLEAVTLGDDALDVVTDVRVDGRTLWYIAGGTTPIPWPSGSQITADYWSGYQEIPADVVMAATTQAAFEYLQTVNKGARLGLRSTSPQSGESDTYVDHGWDQAVLEALHPYRKFD